MRRKTKSAPPSKRYHFRLSKVQLVCIIGAIVMGYLWMFGLGILTGRGVIFSKIPYFHESPGETGTKLDKVSGKETGEANTNKELTPAAVEKELEFFHEVEEKDKKKVKQPSKKVSRVERENKKKEKTSSRNEEVRKKPEPGKTPTPAKRGKYLVQVASFRKRVMAEKMVAKLKKLGFKSSVEEVQLKEKGTWFRVLSDTFADLESANDYAKSIASKFGISPLVIKSRN